MPGRPFECNDFPLIIGRNIGELEFGILKECRVFPTELLACCAMLSSFLLLLASHPIAFVTKSLK